MTITRDNAIKITRDNALTITRDCIITTHDSAIMILMSLLI